MQISRTLINWYLSKKRDLPWRNTSNPYYIWISEVIMQQTRIAQGLSYYQRFIATFPDIQTLANADINEVLKVWQGLGYYSRARNLHTGAKYVVQQHHGILPADYTSLLKIKGVGEYTAAAIGSIAFNLPVPVVDGNVNRVLSRIYGVHDPVNSTLGIKRIKEIAGKILDPYNPGSHNQALMEFGALQCVVHNPNCEDCPLNNLCYARKHQEVEILPNKIKTKKARIRYFNYLVILYHNYIAIQKRPEKDIWQGLYEFPLIETNHAVDKKTLLAMSEWKTYFYEFDYQIVNISEIFIHKLTHQTIKTQFIMVSVKTIPDQLKNEMILVKKNELHQYPVSKLIENYISTIDL
jgi:A/G-specific adenine glycosylase